MVEEILPGLFKIEVPLPRNPLKALNSYVIRDSARNLIIDTGMNREECRSAMVAGLEQLHVDLAETDFLLTHMHADHSGLVASLAVDSATVRCHELDATIVRFGPDWEDMRANARRHGFPAEQLRDAIERHPAYRYGFGGRPLTFVPIAEGDIVATGGYSFRCIETPGHTRGHVCLYEPERKLLISGDHILKDITPNISIWSDQANALREYLDSLDKVSRLDVRLVLPGHRRLIEDMQERIGQLKHHHQVRAAEVLAIVERGSKNAYQVAAEMTWDMKYDSFEEFPVSQKWFATGEAIAHLRYLQDEGQIHRESRGDALVYFH